MSMTSQDLILSVYIYEFSSLGQRMILLDTYHAYAAKYQAYSKRELFLGFVYRRFAFKSAHNKTSYGIRGLSTSVLH